MAMIWGHIFESDRGGKSPLTGYSEAARVVGRPWEMVFCASLLHQIVRAGKENTYHIIYQTSVSNISVRQLNTSRSDQVD